MFARNDARGKRVETDTMRALAGAAAYTDGPRRNAEYNPAHFTLLHPHLRISLYFEKAGSYGERLSLTLRGTATLHSPSLTAQASACSQALMPKHGASVSPADKAANGDYQISLASGMARIARRRHDMKYSDPASDGVSRLSCCWLARFAIRKTWSLQNVFDAEK